LSTVITGAGGQLGHALADVFPEARRLTREDWDVTFPPPDGLDADLLLHAAAWTNVDGAEDDPQSAAAVNVGGTLNVASLEVPLVAYSSDYVFDGTKRTPYLESDSPSPLGAYGRTKLHGEAAAGELAWIVRTSWLFGPTGNNFLRTMLRLGAERDEVAVVDDQRGCPTYAPDLAGALARLAVERRPGVYHVTNAGACTWHDLAAAAVELDGLDPSAIGTTTTAELGRPAPRPANSVLSGAAWAAAGLTPLRPWREALAERMSETAGLGSMAVQPAAAGREA
jgi:dTDP-4-dehydrorhamnose reductase